VAIAHVGDSRAYLFRDGELKRLTKDHSLVQVLVDQDKLTEEEAEQHPQRSIITRALGPEPTVDVDTWRYPVRAGDVLLLCSDGLTSMITDDRIARVLSSTANLNDAAQGLIDEANEAGGRDNITVVLFRVEEVGSAGAVEQPTAVAMQAVPAAPDGAPATSEAKLPVAPPPSLPASEPDAPRKAPRLARKQGRPAPDEQPRRGRRFHRPIAALIAVIVVLFLVAGGGYLATRQLYFVGTNNEGIVTIFRGLPYDLPAGIHLYESFYVSGVPAAEIPADRRSTVLNHNLRSESSAAKLVEQLELGQLTK
jgi:protein phosphatase